MDPYLEAHWDDMHARLVIYLSEALQRSRPNDLRARIEERVFVESDDRELRSIYPDVRIDERTRPAHLRPQLPRAEPGERGAHEMFECFLRAGGRARDSSVVTGGTAVTGVPGSLRPSGRLTGTHARRPATS